MQESDEIVEFIRAEVAGCKAMEPDAVDIDKPVVEDIGLIGDDVTEIDYLLCKRYGVKTQNSDYVRRMSIRDWANVIARKIA
ncbi:hypothetical protein [Erythrobacter aurantius]|uniref:hypothetical protein n=1 Tax=Erythrobacter aurantius TaxID=2909249 RepID=UPI00207A7208|nr:hypothetical protein [Erythrobacter aurantius]